MYCDLKESLRWQTPMPEAKALARNLESNADRRYRRFLDDGDRVTPAERARLSRAADALPPAALTQCQSSPQGIFAASRMCEREEAIAYFDGAFAAAAIEEGLEAEHMGGTIWSAKGDRSYRQHGLGSGNWRREYSAPVLDGYLPVDTRCPATQGTLPGIESRTEAVETEDEDRLFALLTTAHSLIERGSPLTRRFLEDFARVIVVRNSATDEGFQSAGARVTAGRMVMINPLGADGKPELITDGLVHESIHCAIDHCEFVEPILTVIATDVTIDSPWTGKRLDLNTFIHASFVWYGLVHFWTIANEKAGQTTAGAREMLATARKGFLAVHPSVLIAPHVALLNPEVVQAVGEMRLPG